MVRFSAVGSVEYLEVSAPEVVFLDDVELIGASWRSGRSALGDLGYSLTWSDGATFVFGDEAFAVFVEGQRVLDGESVSS